MDQPPPPPPNVGSMNTRIPVQTNRRADSNELATCLCSRNIPFWKNTYTRDGSRKQRERGSMISALPLLQSVGGRFETITTTSPHHDIHKRNHPNPISSPFIENATDTMSVAGRGGIAPFLPSAKSISSRMCMFCGKGLAETTTTLSFTIRIGSKNDRS